MNLKLAEILDRHGQLIVDAIRQALVDADRVATGRTRDSIQHEVTGDNVLTVTGRDATLTLEYGRPPTGEGVSGVSYEKGSFYQQIVEWVAARGIDEAAAYPIYVKINREGFEGTEGLISQPVDEAIQNMIKAVEQYIDSEVDTHIQNIWT